MNLRRSLVAMAAALVLAALALLTAGAPASAAAVDTRAKVVKRGKALAYSKSLSGFVAVKTHAKAGIDKRFNWRDDGCSAPFDLGTAHWQRVFRRSCQRHDFGYRNFGHGLNLGSNQPNKQRIDTQFREDMLAQCNYYSGNKTACRAASFAFYTAVSRAAQAHTAFHAKRCLERRFCLFDDVGYEDRRVALSKSEDDLKDVDFGDKTSSLKNRTAVAWMIFEDDGREGTRYCIRPGRSVADLGKFGDETSSVKRLSGSGCPAGVDSIGS